VSGFIRTDKRLATRDSLRNVAEHGFACTGLGQSRKIVVKTVEALMRGIHDDAERLPPLGRQEGFKRAPRERSGKSGAQPVLEF
jgi:hypothetical protein